LYGSHATVTKTSLINTDQIRSQLVSLLKKGQDCTLLTTNHTSHIVSSSMNQNGSLEIEINNDLYQGPNSPSNYINRQANVRTTKFTIDKSGKLSVSGALSKRFWSDAKYTEKFYVTCYSVSK